MATWNGIEAPIATPSNVTLPSFTGNAAVAATLQGATGTWLRADEYNYQWLSDGYEIAGATSSSYVVTGDEAGETISLRVAATGAGGTEYEVSTGLAIPLVPVPMPLVVTQINVEPIYNKTVDRIVTQVNVEPIYNKTVDGRVSQVNVESVYNKTVDGRVGQVNVEVVRSTA